MLLVGPSTRLFAGRRRRGWGRDLGGGWGLAHRLRPPGANVSRTNREKRSSPLLKQPYGRALPSHATQCVYVRRGRWLGQGCLQVLCRAASSPADATLGHAGTYARPEGYS